MWARHIATFSADSLFFFFELLGRVHILGTELTCNGAGMVNKNTSPILQYSWLADVNIT